MAVLVKMIMDILELVFQFFFFFLCIRSFLCNECLVFVGDVGFQIREVDEVAGVHLQFRFEYSQLAGLRSRNSLQDIKVKG